MKSIRFKLTMIVIMVQLSGCDLHEDIYSVSSPGNTILTAEDLDYLLIGAYAQLNYPQFFKRDLRRMVTAYADDLSSVHGTAMGTYGSKIGNNSGFAPNYNVWSTIFVCISNANSVLRYVDELDLTPSFAARTEGEALFLRAFCYFLLVQMWGDVPLWLDVADGGSDFYLPRSSVDDVYAQIFSDLENAAPGLRNRTETPRYRASQGAAKGYLAKAYLTYANYLDLRGRSNEAQTYYQRAKDTANEVISSNEYRLIEDFGDLWDVGKEVSSYNEVIFGIGFTRDPTNTTANGEGSPLPQDFLPNSLPNSTGSANTRGSGAVRIHPWFTEKYLAGEYVGDYRVEKSFLLTWKDWQSKQRYAFPLIPQANGVAEAQAYVYKYVDPQGLSNDGHENDLYLLRLAELYLIKAEAENELNGPTSEALDAFNKLRERARNADGVARTVPKNITIVDVPSKEDFRLKIFDERGLEFVGEFHRWFDLVRMQYRDSGQTMYEYQFGTFLPTLEPGLPSFSGGEWTSGRTEASNIVPFDAKYLSYPIPANERGTNPSLTQNLGW